MQILLPMGGRGTRVRPHSHIRPKPLISIAGKPVLGHILDDLLQLEPSEVILITNPGVPGEQVRDYVTSAYPALRARFLVQEQARGQAHAIALAEPFVHEPLLIMFIDTLFEADMAVLRQPPADGVAVTHYVEDPRRFGIAVSEGGRIVRFVEKPETPVSHDAVIGVYVINHPEQLFQAIRTLVERGGTRGGEYFLADALQIMVDEGARLTALAATVWQDTGTIGAIVGSEGPPFQALNYLLSRHGVVSGDHPGSVFIPPVYVPASATVRESVVGPYVSLGENVSIERSVLRQSLIGAGARLRDVALADSLIGEAAAVTREPAALNISDHSEARL